MKTPLDCVSCLIRQSLETVRRCKLSPDRQKVAVREILCRASTLEYDKSPPSLSGQMQSTLRSLTKVDDPYLDEKQRFTRVALDLLPPLEEAVKTSSDPFESAVKLAIAGNVIDLGAKSTLTEAEVRDVINGALEKPLRGELEAFRAAAASARSILYLADNAGETVFDRLLLEQLPHGRVTIAVRGEAILNDATRNEAVAAGMDGFGEIVDNGSGAPGTDLESCSEEFRQRFFKADLIISKGQGSFETLHETKAPLFFLFRIKCALVSDYCGYPEGSHVVLRPHETLDCR